MLFSNPINGTSENEVIGAARQSGKTLSQLQEDFLFPLFNCSSVLPPSLPPLHPCPQASFALGQRQLLDAAHVAPSGREERKGPAEGPPGRGGTLAAAVGSALPVLARGCGQNCSWKPLASPKPIPPLGLMVGWQGWKLCRFPPLGHLFGTVKSAQHGRHENLYILPPKI